MFIVKLKPIYIKRYVVFQIQLHKKLSKGNTRLVEKLGYYNTDPFHKIISINGQRFGFWLNRGAIINASVYKVLRRFLAKTN